MTKIQKNMMKIIFITMMTLMFTLYLWIPITLSDPIEITIFHTNDIHAQYVPTKAIWLENKPEIGGFNALSHYVKVERSGLKRSLLFDAGDLMTGSMICDLEYKNAYGGALIEMMNKIGYDGMVIGNHEFDIGASNIRSLIEIAEFPVLCSNLLKDGKKFSEPGYHIYELNGLKVGVIGVTYHPMAGMAPDVKLDGFNSIEPAIAVNEIVSEIDSLTDLIIVLSHSGFDSDKEMAVNLNGVDVIIGGHSHTNLKTPIVINDILIVQAGSKTRYLGRLDLVVENDRVVDFDGELIPTFTENITPNSDVSEIVAYSDSIINEKYGEIVCELKSKWNPRGKYETNVGNFIADGIRGIALSDIGLVNSGSIRKSLGPGPVSRRDILEMIPFDNEVVTFNCTGEQLKKIAEEIVNGGESLQISGMTFKWRNTESGQEIVELTVNDKPVIDDQVYKVASIDYIVLFNSERYFGYLVDQYEKSGYSVKEVITNAAAKQKVIDSKIEGRIVKID